MPAARRPITARCARGIAVLLTLAAMGGCATVPPPGAGGAPAQPSPIDPWENWNRKVYAFNEAVDDALLKPVATAYRDLVPRLVRTGIGNVLGNIYDIWSAANHLLQGKVPSGLDMGMRVLTNTLFGLGGLLDPASEMGLTRRSEDFGQTLGRWGLPNGPYLVLPFLGPSTIRDTAGLLVDRQTAPASLPHRDAGSYTTTALEIVHQRANLLQTTQLLGELALDPYAFLRDAYLSRRRDLLYDGAPPLEDFDDDDFEDDVADDPPAPPAKPSPQPPPASRQ